MSGFLQRLATGVLRSQRAIHPSLGTIRSDAGMRGARGSHDPIESLSEVLAQRRADAPPSPETQPQTPRGSRISDNEVNEPPEQAAVEKPVAFPPPVAYSQRSAVSMPPAPQANAEAREPEEFTLAARMPSSLVQDTGSRQPHRIELTQRLVPSPIVPPLQTPGPAMAADHKSPPHLPLSQPRAPPAQSHAQERDSIEIHIGRIEVLAAPPRSEQPAAPARARKSIDLAEYLRNKRGSR